MIEWKSSKIKKLLSDFDADISTRNVTGSAGDKRTEAIVIKPGGSTNKFEIMGVADEKIEYKNRKKVDVKYIEIRGVVESSDEQIKIANAIIKDRLIKSGFKVKEKKKMKRNYSYPGHSR